MMAFHNASSNWSVYFSASVPLNYITSFITGTLGIPGFILVYVLTKIVLV